MIYIYAVIGMILGGFISFYLYSEKGEFINTDFACKFCHHPFKGKDIIPAFSYLLHRGKCPYCHKKYSAIYVYLPLLNSFASVLLYDVFDDAFKSLIFVLLHSIILCMAMMDIKTKNVSTKLFVLLLTLGIGWSLYEVDMSLYERMIALCIGAVPFLLLSFVFKNKIGSGDGLFLGMIGFILGVEGIVLCIVFGYLIAGIYSLILLILKKAYRKTKIAMFPFFYLVMMAYLLYTPTIHQYIRITMN